MIFFEKQLTEQLVKKRACKDNVFSGIYVHNCRNRRQNEGGYIERKIKTKK